MEMQAQPTDERFTWTMALIDATLALRFKDEQLRDDIERARGNEAKRKAWHALAQRLQKEEGISVPEAKLRRVISKWQSQHRAYTQALATKSASELSLMDRPPTYMPALQRYFNDETKDVETEKGTAEARKGSTEELPEPTTIPLEDEDGPLTPPEPLVKKSSIGEPPKRPQRPAMVYDVPEPKQRKLSPQKRVESPLNPTTDLKAGDRDVTNEKQPVVPIPNEDRAASTSSKAGHTVEVEQSATNTASSKSKATRELVARATQRLSDTQKEQLTLQKMHFEEQLAMQRKQYDEQFAVQRKQVEAVHSILESLLGSVDV